MLTFKALSVAFRELRAPELEALQEELEDVKEKWEGAEDEVRQHLIQSQSEAELRELLNSRIVFLENENRRLKEIALSQQQEILRSQERLHKKRKTEDSSK